MSSWTRSHHPGPRLDAPHAQGFQPLDGWWGHTGEGLGFTSLGMYEPETGSAVVIFRTSPRPLSLAILASSGQAPSRTKVCRLFNFERAPRWFSLTHVVVIVRSATVLGLGSVVRC